MKKEAREPIVGIGVMIIKDGKVLLGKRKGSHGEGEYAFPGGHLKYMESFTDCAEREIKEECGIKVKNLRFQCVGNIIKYAPKQYILIGFLADWESGEPTALEPEKCEYWSWYDINNPPEPLFETCKLAIDSYQNNKNYFDVPDVK
jgi:8-oxo-dGTP diphosphatase